MLADDLRLALDRVAFARSLGFEPDRWQEQVLRWFGKRLLLNWHRQSGKSTTTSLLATHEAIYSPASLILLISPSLRQSGELYRKVRAWLGLAGATPDLIEDNRLSCSLTNKSRIVSLPNSEATVRGYSGARLIIEDEASRVDDDLYRAVRPMLAVSGGRLILMSTPFGRRGHFYSEWTDGGGGWERLKLTASQNPRIDPAFLEEERHSLGPWWFSQEYGGEFQADVDAAFSYEAILDAFTIAQPTVYRGQLT